MPQSCFSRIFELRNLISCCHAKMDPASSSSPSSADPIYEDIDSVRVKCTAPSPSKCIRRSSYILAVSQSQMSLAVPSKELATLNETENARANTKCRILRQFQKVLPARTPSPPPDLSCEQIIFKVRTRFGIEYFLVSLTFFFVFIDC